MSRLRDEDEDEDDLGFVASQSSGPPREHILLKEGYLQKKSPKGFVKVWQSRYFKLFTDGLEYYKNKRDKAPAGSIPLFAISDVSINHQKSKKGDRFDIIIGDDKKTGRVFALVAPTKDDAAKWVELLTMLLKEIAEQNASRGATPSVSGEGKFWKDSEKVEILRQKSEAAQAAAKEDLKIVEERKSVGPTSAVVELELISEIKAGPFGHVYHGKEKKPSVPSFPQQTFVVHVVSKSDPELHTAEQLLGDMQTIDSPYITRQLVHSETADAVYGVYAPAFSSSDSLVAYLEENRRFPEEVVRFFAAQIVLALEHLHNKGVVAYSLSPEVLFVDADGHAVLSDVALALPEAKQPVDGAVVEYTTPEGTSTPAGDWWRLGVLIYEMTVGFPPFRSKSENHEEDILSQIESFSPDKLRFPPFASSEMQDLVRALLNPNVSERLGAASVEDVKSHAYFKHEDVDWNVFAARRGVPRESAPVWVKKTILEAGKDEDRMTYLRALPLRYAHSISVEVLTARLQPPAPKHVFCSVTYGGKTQKTDMKPETLMPEFGDKFYFDVDLSTYEALELTVALARTETDVIGSAAVSAADVKLSYPNAVDVWQTIIDAAGMPRGELHVRYLWQADRVEIPLPTYSADASAKDQPFLEHFGRPSNMKSTHITHIRLVSKKASISVADEKSEDSRAEGDEDSPLKDRSASISTASAVSSDDMREARASVSEVHTSGPEDDEEAASDEEGDADEAAALAEFERQQQEAAKVAAADEEARLKAEEEDAARKLAEAEEEAERKRAEADKLRRLEEEEAARLRQEEQERQRAEAEAERIRLEEERLRLEAEEAERKRQEEEERLRREEEELLRREEEERLRLEAEEQRRREEEAERRRKEDEERERLRNEEEERRRKEDDERRKKEDEDDQRRRQEEEERRRQQEEENRRLQQELDEERRKLDEERNRLYEERQKLERERMEEEKLRIEEERRRLEEERNLMAAQLAAERARLEAERHKAEVARQEAEKLAAEAARAAAEREAIEKARQEAEDAARAAAEKAAAAEAARKAAVAERLAREKAAREKAEKEKLEREKADREAASNYGPCRSCDCKVFTMNLFKKSQCASCFHEHSPAPKSEAKNSSVGNTAAVPKGDAAAEVINRPCRECTCVEFKVNLFKKGQCSLCFHSH